uniref:Uncharacterized protein n=1 Tax=Terrapene triunguis TaxID=2587831 RepID=A0A674JYQ6_9SAUR
MAARSRVKDLQEAVICSICLAYFNDPVILKCGHNFCRSCISQYCKESKTSPSYPCPQCREPFQEGEFQPNRQLRNVVEIAKKFPEPRGKKACEKHEELLKLFCEVDQTPICVVCRESRSHKDHSVLPVDEAAVDYQVIFAFGTHPSPDMLEQSEHKGIPCAGKNPHGGRKLHKFQLTEFPFNGCRVGGAGFASQTQCTTAGGAWPIPADFLNSAEAGVG